ncbi:MAG: hypothetical protein KDD25_03760, partial [Bdellovibrionales bacterium]|nr:hypothetical protein [Bdellovibrionales bacterium]
TDENLRAESLVYLTQLYISDQRFSDALRAYNEIAISSNGSITCESDSCKELRSRITKNLVSWYKSESKTPSLEIFESFAKMLPILNDDSLKTIAAEVALNRKEYDRFFAWNQEAINSLSIRQKEGKASPQELANLETLLLKSIEVAEKSQNAGRLKVAQEAYLSSSPTQSKRAEVHYQMVRGDYDQKNYKSASEGFYAIAKDEKVSMELRNKSADLALDSLVLLENHQALENWSAEFAQVFPARRNEFIAIKNKSVLTQSAKLATDTGEKSKDSGRAIAAILDRFDVSSASPKELAVYYKNKTILAFKSGDVREQGRAAKALLDVPGISNEDREFALTQIIWTSELNLDFQQALATYEKWKPVNVRKSEDWLKMGLLAELGNKNANQYYEKYLATDASQEDKVRVCERISSGASTWKGVNPVCSKLIIEAPSALMNLAIRLYESGGTSSFSNNASVIKKVKEQKAAQWLFRGEFWSVFDKTNKAIQSHQISQNQARAGQDLKRRIRLLGDLEKVANQAIGTTDWVFQVVALTSFSNENLRLYNEIVAMPVPEGLTDEERVNYTQLIEQQVAPYMQAHLSIQDKLKTLWDFKDGLVALQNAYEKSSGMLRGELKDELGRVSSIAPQERVDGISTTLASKPQKQSIEVTIQDVENAKSAVRESPLDKSRVLTLLELERKRGNSTMVEYLETRTARDIKGETGI